MIYQPWSSTEMTDYRIVFNVQTARYRIERRRLWGWTFVMTDDGRDYLGFDRYVDAREHLCRRLRRSDDAQRRWRVVDPCGCEQAVE